MKSGQKIKNDFSGFIICLIQIWKNREDFSQKSIKHLNYREKEKIINQQ
jgi:hypothetical protein